MMMLRSLSWVKPCHRWLSATRVLSSSASSGLSPTFKVAIVGSGPSACYTAKYLPAALQKQLPPLAADGDGAGVKVQVDILERLPTPYGLVRYGVAPDHPEVKNVQTDFDALFESSSGAKAQVRFWGNVTVGRDVSLADLRQHYHAVVLATGCESDNDFLQTLPGYSDVADTSILSARQFVNWYNGHPEFCHKLDPKVDAALSRSGSCCVIGQGNVALDCARILVKGRRGLFETDIASNALQVLGDDRVSHVSIVGRRGHVQAAFTIKEVRELIKLRSEGHDADLVIRENELALNEASQAELDGPGGRPKVRLDKLIREAAASGAPSSSGKRVDLRFLLNPVAFEADPNHPETLGAVVCERTRLEGEPHHQRAVGTGEYERIPASLAIVSIGYQAVPLPGLEPHWWDEEKGRLVHHGGRVDTPHQEVGGLYAVGWYKRGALGIIGTNIMDAKDTVATIVQDVVSQSPDFLSQAAKEGDLSSILKDCPVVDWEGYQRIVQAESAHKRTPEQPREKIVDLDRLLAIGLGQEE